ncbi:hypothetical protein PCE1_002859 [Barthelona sp. PCE]
MNSIYLFGRKVSTWNNDVHQKRYTLNKAMYGICKDDIPKELHNCEDFTIVEIVFSNVVNFDTQVLPRLQAYGKVMFTFQHIRTQDAQGYLVQYEDIIGAATCFDNCADMECLVLMNNDLGELGLDQRDSWLEHPRTSLFIGWAERPELDEAGLMEYIAQKIGVYCKTIRLPRERSNAFLDFNNTKDCCTVYKHLSKTHNLYTPLPKVQFYTLGLLSHPILGPQLKYADGKPRKQHSENMGRIALFLGDHHDMTEEDLYDLFNKYPGFTRVKCKRFVEYDSLGDARHAFIELYEMFKVRNLKLQWAETSNQPSIHDKDFENTGRGGNMRRSHSGHVSNDLCELYWRCEHSISEDKLKIILRNPKDITRMKLANDRGWARYDTHMDAEAVLTQVDGRSIEGSGWIIQWKKKKTRRSRGNSHGGMPYKQQYTDYGPQYTHAQYPMYEYRQRNNYRQGRNNGYPPHNHHHQPHHQPHYHQYQAPPHYGQPQHHHHQQQQHQHQPPHQPQHQHQQYYQ